MIKATGFIIPPLAGDVPPRKGLSIFVASDVRKEILSSGMATPPDNAPPIPSPDRLWAEQLALGMALFLGLLGFMAIYHPKNLSNGAQVLSTGDLAAYGWYSVLGVFFVLLIHELGTLAAARYFQLPLKFRLFPFGVNAAAILTPLPRRAWIDAVVGLAGPVTGALAAILLAGIYAATDNPFFLGMACVSCFYNLFTLIPILELEGGWISPAIAPQFWLAGLVGAVLVLTMGFNLFLAAVVAFGLPRFVQLIRARAPREDLACTGRQRLIVALVYFGLVLALAWCGSTAFVALSRLVPEAMGD
jgi:Zn-dependent protease